MLVKFQIIHKLDQKTFIQTIEEAVNLVNMQIIKDYPSSSEEEELPVKAIFNYYNKQATCSLSSVYLDFSQYSYSYNEDYDHTILMGFEWGAGYVIDKFIGYLDLFIEKIKFNTQIIQIIKYEDTNTQNAYLLLSKEIYELEMSLRELTNYLLFTETVNGNICSALKNKIKVRHSIDKTFLDENLENEIFSLDFTHYQKIFETFPDIFTSSILDDINKIRIFRNSIMHNKGLTSTSPKEFWEVKKRLLCFIEDFWIGV